jgi:hypothetical protein
MAQLTSRHNIVSPILENKPEFDLKAEVNSRVTQLHETTQQLIYDLQPLSGATAPTLTPLRVNQYYLNTATGRAYISNGTTSSANWVKIPIYYQAPPFTITAGAGDITITLPFDWTDGFLELHTSTTTTGYFSTAASGAGQIISTSYLALTSATYTGLQLFTELGTAHAVYGKTVDGDGFPKSATSTTITFNDVTTLYCKLFVWA